MITYINTGTSPNAGNGDSLRLAFTKTNNNFREIANILGTGTSTISQVVTDKISQSFIHNNHVGLTVAPGVGSQVIFTVNTTFNQVSIGNALVNELRVNNNTVYVGNNTLTVNTSNIELNGNTIRSVNQNLNTDDIVTFNGILPNNVNSELGSLSTPWHSLYVSTNTIYIGGKALSVTPSGDVTVDGTPIGESGATNTGEIIFTATTITAPPDNPIRIVSTDTTFNRAVIELAPDVGNVSLQAWSGENTRSDFNAWNTGTWEINIYGNPYMRFTEAYDLVYWFTNTLQNSDPDTVSYSINDGPYIPWDLGSSSDPNTGFLEIYTSGINPPGNTTTNITSLAWKYRFNSRLEVGYNNGLNLDSGDQYIGINAGSYIQMLAKGSIDISNSNASGSDIEINSGDDIWIRGNDKTSSDSEGGDINIEAGDGGPADTGDGGGGGGDIRIIAGNGGNASSTYTGGSGGIIQMYSGDGGAANAANSRQAQPGGTLELQSGTAGFNDGNPAFGAAGGNLEIRAGNSNNYSDNGGNVIIRPGTNTAGTSTVAGYVQIQIPSSSGASGGSWYFEGNGQTLRLPTGGTLGPEGMGWTGLSNGVSETPVSLVYKLSNGNWLSDITLGGDGTSGTIYLTVWNTATGISKALTFNGGGLTFPDGTTQTTAYGFVSPPVSSTSTGVAGTLAQDATYFYVCTATNAWQRISWDSTPW